MSISEEQIDPDAQKVVRRLTRHGFQAYLVGGCVRDLMLGRGPKDFDIATSATPQEIKALFRNCRIIGRRFRLAHIFFGSKIIETSTFRTTPTPIFEGGEAGDATDELLDNGSDPGGDHDGDAAAETATNASEPELLIKHDNVFGTAEEDARRRDFTVNGLFYDLDQHQVIDYVVGLPDLEKRLVRTIGTPDIRFREDPVRMLRAIKFAARLDFTIEPATYQAILDHKAEIQKSAPPRVLEEIYRLLRGGAAARSLDLLNETGLGVELLPTLVERMKADPDGAARLQKALAAVDTLVKNGKVPSNGFLVALLDAVFETDLLYGPEPGPGEPRLDLVREIFDRTRPLQQALRVARRDAERARQMLVAQRRLLPSKRRRGRPLALTRRDWFDEALLLFDLVHRLVGTGTDDIIAKWQKLGQGDGEEPRPTEPAEAASGAESAGPPRRRRRRGGRGRRRNRNGSGGTGADGSDLGSEASAGDSQTQA